MTAVAGKVRAAILASYPRARWRTAFEVRLPKAETNGLRVVDAVAIGRKYPEIHGFEVKTSRADWLNELKDPSKAEAAMRFVNYWWLVIGDSSVVKVEEVPATWGVLVVNSTGSLTLIRAASTLQNGSRWSNSIHGRFILGFLDAYESRSEEKSEELNTP